MVFFKKIFTEPERLPERPYPSSLSPWRGLFTKEVLLECKAKCQSSSPEYSVVSWQLLQTILSNLLWMDRMTQTCPGNLSADRAGLKTAGVTFYKIRSNEVYNLFYCSVMCSNLKKNYIDT